jgi:hypothetical protein
MRPRSEGSTTIEKARPPKRPRGSSGPPYYKQALTSKKIAIFKETYPVEKLTEHGQEKYPGRSGKVVAWDSNRRTTTPQVLHTGGRCTYIL